MNAYRDKPLVTKSNLQSICTTYTQLCVSGMLDDFLDICGMPRRSSRRADMHTVIDEVIATQAWILFAFVHAHSNEEVINVCRAHVWRLTFENPPQRSQLEAMGRLEALRYMPPVRAPFIAVHGEPPEFPHHACQIPKLGNGTWYAL